MLTLTKYRIFLIMIFMVVIVSGVCCFFFCNSSRRISKSDIAYIVANGLLAYLSIEADPETRTSCF